MLVDGATQYVTNAHVFEWQATSSVVDYLVRLGKDGGPFSKEEAELLIYHIALGLEWLHNHNIVHQGLKAFNVLVYEFRSGWPKWLIYIAHNECSIGVVGIGFFRVPKILQACKDKKLHDIFEVFSIADVCSYGMMC